MTSRGLLIESGKEKYVILGWNASAPAAPSLPISCSLEIRPSIIDFGNVSVNRCSNETSINIYNKGQDEAIVNICLKGFDINNFTITENASQHIIFPGSKLTTKVKFCPKTEGEKFSRLFIESFGCDDVYADLYGTGISYQIAPEEKNWPAICGSKDRKIILVVRGSKKNTISSLGYDNNYVYLDKWGNIWTRPRTSPPPPPLYYYNLRTGVSSTIDVKGDWGWGCFTLGDVSGSKLTIFIHVPPAKIEIIRISNTGSEFSKIDDTIYNIYVTPYEMFYDGTNKWCVCGSRYSPYNIKTIDENGIVHCETTAPSAVQGLAQDAYGNYWFNKYEGNEIYVYSENLDHIKTINFESTLKLRDITENENYDIVAIDYDNGRGLVFYEEEDYSIAHEISILTHPYAASPWRGDWIVVTGWPDHDDRFAGVNLKTGEQYIIDSGNRLWAGGDPGLTRCRTWSWNWQPDTDAIKEFLGE